MSLIIKGMEMPKSCLDCPFTYEGDCTADEDLTDIYSFMTEHYPDCPLTELRHPDCPLDKLPTSHGRLIDADAYQYSGDLIDEPTIIEAEVSE